MADLCSMSRTLCTLVPMGHSFPSMDSPTIMSELCNILWKTPWHCLSDFTSMNSKAETLPPKPPWALYYSLLPISSFMSCKNIFTPYVSRLASLPMFLLIDNMASELMMFLLRLTHIQLNNKSSETCLIGLCCVI